MSTGGTSRDGWSAQLIPISYSVWFLYKVEVRDVSEEDHVDPYRMRLTDIVCGRNCLLANKRRTNRDLYHNQHSSSWSYSYQYSPCVRRTNCRFEHPVTEGGSHFQPYATSIPYTYTVSYSRNSSDSPNARPIPYTCPVSHSRHSSDSPYARADTYR